MFCTKCGAQQDDNAMFCTVCGASMKEEQPTPVAVEEPAQVAVEQPAPAPAPQQPVPPQPQQPVYGQPMMQQPGMPVPGAPVPGMPMPGMPVPGKGLAIASMVLGIVSFFCFAVITGVLAIIFGAVAKNKGFKGGMATAGIVCGTIGVALWLLMVIFMPSMVFGLFNL